MWSKYTHTHTQWIRWSESNNISLCVHLCVCVWRTQCKSTSRSSNHSHNRWLLAHWSFYFLFERREKKHTHNWYCVLYIHTIEKDDDEGKRMANVQGERAHTKHRKLCEYLISNFMLKSHVITFYYHYYYYYCSRYIICCTQKCVCVFAYTEHVSYPNTQKSPIHQIRMCI